MWIDAAGTPIGVQQKLMRHADIRMTMNIHGEAASQDMREAQDKIGNSLCGPSKTAGKREVGVCILTARNGSSGRTRTYNPPVNSRMLCH